MKTLIINRNKWRRGYVKTGRTELLNNCGFMCCLGFHSLQFTKAEKEDIKDRSLPSDISCNIGRTILLVKQKIDSAFSDEAANINDNRIISEKQREYKLKKLFKSKNYHIKFTGKKEKNHAKIH